MTHLQMAQKALADELAFVEQLIATRDHGRFTEAQIRAQRAPWVAHQQSFLTHVEASQVGDECRCKYCVLDNDAKERLFKSEWSAFQKELRS